MNSGPDGTWFAMTPEWWAQFPPGSVLGWKLWYADGQTADSLSVAWSHAPREGVEVLMLYHPEERRTVVTGRDEYTLPGESESKLGLEIEESAFNAIAAQAMADLWRC